MGASECHPGAQRLVFLSSALSNGQKGTSFLTCPVCGTGSEWRTAVRALPCCQALGAKAACSASRLLQNLLLDTPGEPTPLTLGRKAYVSLVLKNHQTFRGGRGGKQKVRKWINNG